MTTTETFLLPTHWAVPFINNDWTGIEDDLEEEAMMSFLANEVTGKFCVDVAEETEFAKYHDAADYGVLPSTCAVFTFS